MIQEIKYSGFSASPSDYECPDGELATVLGLVPDEGHLKPILPPGSVFQLSEGKVVRFIHKSLTFGKHYILSDNNGNLFWTVDGTEENPIDYHFDSEIYEIEATGNVLLVLCADGMHYVVWKGDDNGYKHLGTHIPELSIQFGLLSSMASESVSVAGDEGLLPPQTYEYPDYPLDPVFLRTASPGFTEHIMAQCNKMLSDWTEQGYFSSPFFVRYAYRLYDGSLTMQSAPVLMVPASKPNIFCYLQEFDNSHTKYMMGGVISRLQIKGYDEAVMAELATDWKDIVQSVEVFVTKPVFTYDQNATAMTFAKANDWDNLGTTVKGFDGGYVIGDCAFIAPQHNGYRKHSIAEMLNPLYNTIDYICNIPTRQRPDIDDDIRNSHLFYHLQSLDIENVPIFFQLNKPEKGYLSTIVERELMTDDYDSHDSLIPRFAHPYNGRLNIANLTKRVFDGFSPESSLIYTDSSSEVFQQWQMRVFYFLRQDNKEIIVDGGQSLVGYKSPVLYLYYPSPYAYKAVVVFGNNEMAFSLPMKPHDFLNGSYYYGSYDGLNTDIYSGIPYPGALPTPSLDREILINNKIYTSEVNNPFYFPVTGINTIGTGNILGISTAAQALSQGQFGQFPLYAFTDEGVWALTVAANGGFTAVQPITRDVCINSKSITQLDNSVLFATDRGIMLLGGSTSVCISDILNYEQVFSLSSLPQADKLAEMVGFTERNFNYVQFREFLRGCQMIYAYTLQRIIVYNPAHTYAYIYSLKTKTWGMMPSDITHSVPSYPEALAMLSDGSLVDFSTSSTDGVPTPSSGFKGLLITRPLKFDAPDIMKTIDTVIQRGDFRYGHVKSALYGSRNLEDWSMVWTSNDHYLRGFRGTPYKYFRIAALCDLAPDESLYGATVQFTPRLTDKLR